MKHDSKTSFETAKRVLPFWTFRPYGRLMPIINPNRPQHPPIFPDQIPEELKSLPKWVCWDWGWRDPKWRKYPISPVTGDTTLWGYGWGTFEQAINFKTDNQLAGIGLAMSDDDTLAVVDLDNCVDPQTGHIEEWASLIVSGLDSYSEYSPSGTGIHVVVHGRPNPTQERPEYPHRPEIFSDFGFVTVTGARLPGLPTTPKFRYAQLQSVVIESREGLWSPNQSLGQFIDYPRPHIRADMLSVPTIFGQIDFSWQDVIGSQLDIERYRSLHQSGQSEVISLSDGWEDRTGYESESSSVSEEYVEASEATTGRPLWRRYGVFERMVTSHPSDSSELPQADRAIVWRPSHRDFESIDLHTGSRFWSATIDDPIYSAGEELAEQHVSKERPWESHRYVWEEDRSYVHWESSNELIAVANGRRGIVFAIDLATGNYSWVSEIGGPIIWLAILPGVVLAATWHQIHAYAY